MRFHTLKRVRSLGPANAVRFWLALAHEALVSDQRILTIGARDAAHPLLLRANTGDRTVAEQIFLEREYACVADLPDGGLIIDCGANCGYSAAFFLTRFPHATVIALEPDPATFAVLTANLKPYGDRVQARNVAVWSHPTNLALHRDYGDGQPWARQTRTPQGGEHGSVLAIDIGTLLEESGSERISLLKVDIEGAEAVVFADAPWIDRVDNIVIELHDDSSFGDCVSIFRAAIAGHCYEVSELGERTVCRSTKHVASRAERLTDGLGPFV